MHCNVNARCKHCYTSSAGTFTSETLASLRIWKNGADAEGTAKRFELYARTQRQFAELSETGRLEYLFAAFLNYRPITGVGRPPC